MKTYGVERCFSIIVFQPTVVAENKPEESSSDIHKQRCRIETSETIAKAIKLADEGMLNSFNSIDPG